MKRTKIDKLGRIVIPISYRKELGLSENSLLCLELLNGNIVISRSELRCRLCGCVIGAPNEFFICESCIAKIKDW